MNKERFLAYFKKKSQRKDETDGIQITNVLTSVTENVTSVELAYAEDEMQKTYEYPKKYQVEIPGKIKREVGTASAIKKFTTILLSEPQLTPGRTSAMMMTVLLSRELEDPNC